MPRLLDPPKLPKTPGLTSHGVLLGAPFKRLVTSPQPGADPDGSFPATLEEQAERAFDNVLALLQAAGLEPRDLVRIAIHCRGESAADRVAAVRDRRIGPSRPAYAYREVAGFAHPDCLIEIEIEAVREA